MANNHKNHTSFLEKLIAGAIGGFLLVVGYAIVYSMVGLLFPIKRPASRFLDLKLFSASWYKLIWLYRAVQGIALMTALLALGLAAREFTKSPPQTISILMGALYGSLCLASVLVFDIIFWLKQYADDPLVQKNVAGLKAELAVEKLLRRAQANYEGSCAVHGTLFVFNPGTKEEYSLETDHIFITQKNIFVIETKYKSGTISAKADAPVWQVSSNRGESSMRNALKQAKNAVRVLTQECRLACYVIPVVVVCGNDVKIIDGPANVITATELVEVISAFEHDVPRNLIDPNIVMDQLTQYVSTDPLAMARHKERAKQSQLNSEKKMIVRTASLN